MLLSSQPPRLLFLITLVALTFLLYLRVTTQRVSFSTYFTEGTAYFDQEQDAQSIGNQIRDLFAPLVHGFKAPLKLADGKEYEIPSDAVWNEPLGEKLCIVDIDTRPFNGDNEPWNSNGTFSWDKINHSSGVLNHYLYGVQRVFHPLLPPYRR